MGAAARQNVRKLHMRLNFMSLMVRGDASLTDLICLSCKHKNRMETNTVNCLMASLELLRHHCPDCKMPYCDQATEKQEDRAPMDSEFLRFGKTIAAVLTHRGDVDDLDLDSNISFILLNKLQDQGLTSLSKPERYIRAVQEMRREVNNGGFDQFFHNNSGELAFDLVPASFGERGIATSRRSFVDE